MEESHPFDDETHTVFSALGDSILCRNNQIVITTKITYGSKNRFIYEFESKILSIHHNFDHLSPKEWWERRVDVFVEGNSKSVFSMVINPEDGTVDFVEIDLYDIPLKVYVAGRSICYITRDFTVYTTRHDRKRSSFRDVCTTQYWNGLPYGWQNPKQYLEIQETVSVSGVEYKKDDFYAVFLVDSLFFVFSAESGMMMDRRSNGGIGDMIIPGVMKFEKHPTKNEVRFQDFKGSIVRVRFHDRYCFVLSQLCWDDKEVLGIQEREKYKEQYFVIRTLSLLENDELIGSPFDTQYKTPQKNLFPPDEDCCETEYPGPFDDHVCKLIDNSMNRIAVPEWSNVSFEPENIILENNIKVNTSTFVLDNPHKKIEVEEENSNATLYHKGNYVVIIEQNKFSNQITLLYCPCKTIFEYRQYNGIEISQKRYYATVDYSDKIITLPTFFYLSERLITFCRNSIICMSNTLKSKFKDDYRNIKENAIVKRFCIEKRETEFMVFIWSEKGVEVNYKEILDIILNDNFSIPGFELIGDLNSRLLSFYV